MKSYARIILCFLLLLWTAGLANPVYLPAPVSTAASFILTPFYAPVCHQAESRSFIINSGKFLVCARCTGIYLGAFVMVFISLFIKKIKPYFIIPSVLLMLADVLCTSAGIYNYTKGIAFITGFLPGFTLFAYILNILENSFLHET